MYYGDPAQFGRMVRFYGRFIRAGDLAFDIGAHVGSRIPAWSRLGARVVAVEPQPACMAVLRRCYGFRSNVLLVQSAVGEESGQQEMLISDREPTVSTLSPAWAEHLAGARASFARVRWNRRVVVPVTTLDTLIDRHGEPSFCKIDVEGSDLDALRGLSRALPAISVECIPGAAELAVACIDRLSELGDYEFNWSPGESMRLHFPAWVRGHDLAQHLLALPADSNPGDFYARLSRTT
jgi:FkbM family methyltransferase